MATEHEPGTPIAKRIIKRYSNRKLYDTKASTYVTLLQIAEMVRAGEEVQIIDNATKEDKTDVTLALIISEELRATPRGIPVWTLKSLIRERGERLLSQLRESPVGRFIPNEEARAEDAAGVGDAAGAAGEQVAAAPGVERGPEQVPEPGQAAPALPRIMESSPPESAEGRREAAKGIRAALEQWQLAADERIRSLLPSFSLLRELEQQVGQLRARVAELEARLGIEAQGQKAPQAETAPHGRTKAKEPQG